jgi:hypothetical protein
MEDGWMCTCVQCNPWLHDKIYDDDSDIASYVDIQFPSIQVRVEHTNEVFVIFLNVDLKVYEVHNKMKEHKPDLDRNNMWLLDHKTYRVMGFDEIIYDDNSKFILQQR